MSTAVPAITATLIADCKSRLRTERERLYAAYRTQQKPRPLLHGHARLVDQVLQTIWRALAIDRRLALVAVGGYGRGELYPGSDVDLLILLPEDASPQQHAQLEHLIGLFWDIGLDIGHSVRTVAECIHAGQSDITVQTALLETRLLAGNRELFREFTTSFLHHLDPLQFLKAKRLEQEERYAKHNDTPYALEPNCKENPGGLRDLQVILWIARAASLGDSWGTLSTAGVATPTEARLLTRSEQFLQRTRIALHLHTNRREDRLLFDHQETVAQVLGFAASATQRAASVMMKQYYRTAKHVTQLNTLLLLDLASRLERRPPITPIVISPHFQMVHEMLDMRHADLFDTHPEAILESFLLLSQRSELADMTPRTWRALWHAHGRIDTRFRRTPQNRARFLALFKEKRGLTHQLRRMNQFGILGAYLPAFGDIVGQMQHDLFHAYTVDQHTLQVIRNLRRVSLPEFAHELPFCSRLMAGLPERWRLYVAALFHDIAKGRGGDHSKLGMADARTFCNEHGIANADTAFIVFLVEHHLTMSAVAQKQDLADPEVILRFAEIVGTEERLTALYLLTVCDIRGTSPKVWNAWKAKLLEDLYRMTRRLLGGEQFAPLTGIESRQDDARRLLRLRGLMSGIENALWGQLDTAYFLRHDSEEISWHTLTLYHRHASADPIVRTRLNPAGTGLQTMIYCPDQPELFARICGFFARLGFSIVDAKIHTTRHGYALDSFVLLDADNDLPYRDMIGLIDHDLAEQLRLQPALPAPTRGRVSRLVRHQPLEPQVSIRAGDAQRQHVLSLIAADRAGLLYAIAVVLARHGVRLSSAKIATLGERVEDTFLISGEELEHTATLVRLEQELLEVLHI